MRSKQVAKNMSLEMMNQIVTIVLGFASKTVFIYTLEETFLGISGIFTSLLSVLNMSELGIGAAITYSLYAPLAKGDHEKISAIMRFYRNAYRLIGLVILVLGLGLTPFLNYFVSDDVSSVVNIYAIYLLYLIESVSSYWIGAYKSTLLEANQQKYIVTFYTSIESIVSFSLKIATLVILRNSPLISFYTYLGIGIAARVVLNVLLAKRTDKEHPYIRGAARHLTREEKKPITKNVAGLFIGKLSGEMLTSADNILISAFISTITVGLYSNYLLLKKMVVKPIGIVFDSMTASIGNFCASESLDKQKMFFSTLQFTYFWIYGFCGICFWILFNPFIAGVWIGEKYLLSDLCVFLIVTNFVLDGLAGAVINFRTVHGLYWETKYRYFFSAVFNVIVSYLLIKPLGVAGVLLGSTASILIMISFDPVIVFRKVFHESALPYYFSYVGYLLLVLLTGFLVTVLVSPFSEYTKFNFAAKLCVCCIVPNCLWYVIFRKNENMAYLLNYVKNLLKQFKTLVREGLK